MYTPDDDFNGMVADEIERSCGKRPTPEDLGGPDDLDAGYDPDAEAARRLGLSLTDYLNFVIDLEVIGPDPIPTDAELDAMFAADRPRVAA
jgi:hypothetical protein